MPTVAEVRQFSLLTKQVLKKIWDRYKQHFFLRWEAIFEQQNLRTKQ
jgi:hypothetical protein